MPAELNSVWVLHDLDKIPLCPITAICRTGPVRLCILIYRFLREGDY